MDAIFVDRTERSYTNQQGAEKVARNVTLSVDGVGTGQVFVTEDVYKSLEGAKFGAPVTVEFTMSLFRGSMEPRVMRIIPRVAR